MFTLQTDTSLDFDVDGYFQSNEIVGEKNE